MGYGARQKVLTFSAAEDRLQPVPAEIGGKGATNGLIFLQKEF